MHGRRGGNGSYEERALVKFGSVTRNADERVGFVWIVFHLP